MKTIGVVRFPGTNCDRDVWYAIELLGHRPEWIWYQEDFDPELYQALILPGGFSYGDYLRSGALAARAPVMQTVKHFAESGKPILGICNGFQILCEAEMLPGVLLKNKSGLFVDKWVDLKIHNSKALSECETNWKLPVAHGDGCYFHPNPDELVSSGEVWLTYRENPNGSIQDIAGVRRGLIFGLMPHPERALHSWMGGEHGRDLLNSFFMEARV